MRNRHRGGIVNSLLIDAGGAGVQLADHGAQAFRRARLMSVILMNAALHKYIAMHNEIAYIDITEQRVPHERA
ncbi:hypothetical protein ASE23_03295 [Rhizobium sp. Root73]|nr:hypothetical protein ASC96_05525 [Rhizobium sp. Root1204]KRC13544.1 hypothetical protein ASE23_03295 [Rhizobium sp. Root73]